MMALQANRQLMRALYRSFMRSSAKLQREIDRSNQILNIAGEVKRFQAFLPSNAPQLILKPELQNSLPALVRYIFKTNKTVKPSAYDIDSAFNALRDLNKRLHILSNFSYENFSSTTTDGIQVDVQSSNSFMWTEKSKYYFPYIVTIKNNGTRPVQLKDRHWIITEMDGHVIEVEGQGVIGQQPVFPPGYSFSYQSFVPLDAPFATMKGSYTMLHLDDLTSFKVSIGPLGLINNKKDGEST